MSTLSRISTAVLLCLVLAAPAAADSIKLSVSPSSTYLNGPAVAYQVSGETEVGRGYAIRLMTVGWEGSNCGKVAHKYWHNLKEVALQGSNTRFEESLTIPSAENYETLGTYVMCAVTVKSEAPAETSASFTVVTPPPPPPAPPAPVVAPAPAPVVTPLPPATPVVKPVVKPVSKLAKALKLCKKQKNKHKHAKCERAAKKKFRRH